MTAENDPNSAIETFRQAAELNLDDPLRQGSQLVFPNYGQLVVTGDLHGHRRNFTKLVKYCALANSPSRFVLLQELIHEDAEARDQLDTSHGLLLDAARWKCESPDQVFFIQSNHEVAQITGRGIIKAGGEIVKGFLAGVEASYGVEAAPEVMDATAAFIESYPLAARTANRLFISHSLPTQRDMPDFDPSILNRTPTRQELDEGSASKFLWGRRHSDELIEQLAEMLDADLFILGHQPEPMGFRQVGQRVIILSSDHSHGVFLPIDLSRPATMDSLLKRIRKFVSVA